MGLQHFDKFLNQLDAIKSTNYSKNYTLNEVVEALLNNEINVYDLLEDFLYYLQRQPLRMPNGNIVEGKNLSNRSLQFYIAAVRSYLDYNDVVIIPSRFKRRVKVPKLLRYPEQPIDAEDIRNILNSTNSRRLKAYLLVLGSGGMRTIEACAIRVQDVHFEYKPTMIHIRPEFSKTRLGRDIYVSDECTKFLKDWIDFKYRDRQRKDAPEITKDNDSLIFQQANTKDVTPRNIYRPLAKDFNLVLKSLGMDDRKEGMLRRKITLNSFRRFVKSTISDINSDYSEFILGHSGSSYWTKKEPERREFYASKCMRYLTFLDYSALELQGKNIESKLDEKDREIENIKSELTRLKNFELDYNRTFTQRFKEMEENLDYYRRLYGGTPKKKPKKR
jgi:integrase